MRQITDGFKAHIQQGVTTVCTCITITRRDQASFGLTDHDEPVVVSGRTYEPFNSFNRTSISTSSTLEVDQMEIDGILNSDAFAREEIGSGLFDFAEVEVFLVNYEDPTMGTRFGLHGIPAFLVFAGARKLGRITPWPGTEAFATAIETQLATHAPAPG